MLEGTRAARGTQENNVLVVAPGRQAPSFKRLPPLPQIIRRLYPGQLGATADNRTTPEHDSETGDGTTKLRSRLNKWTAFLSAPPSSLLLACCCGWLPRSRMTAQQKRPPPHRSIPGDLPPLPGSIFQQAGSVPASD